MSALARFTASHATPRGRVVLLPASKFFVRRISLVSGQDPDAQAALALEAIGPFAPGQLYYGYRPSADGTQALVFAAYRKNFSAAETALWVDADVVLPDFSPWLAADAPAAPAVWLLESEDGVAAIFWDGQGSLPAGVIVRERAGRPVEAIRQELLDEARKRLGAGEAASRVIPAASVVGLQTKEGQSFSLGKQTTVLTPALLRAMDVRDKTELTGQIGRRQRDRRLWQAFAAGVAALAACVVMELGLQVSHALLGRERTRIEAVTPAVREVEQASQLATRMEKLAGQSLKPFEMLALLNAPRPASLEFVRASSVGALAMEVEAQTGNAADPQAFEQALQRVPEVEKVELRDFRSSGGRTTFLVAVTFKPGFAGPGRVP